MNPTLLLVDDEADFRENVAEYLRAKGFDLLEAADAAAALEHATARRIDAALVDVRMPGMDGVSLLERIKEADPLTEVVIITGHGSIESAVGAMGRGAFHYVTKPVRMAELELVVRRALEKAALARQNQVYREGERRRRDRWGGRIVAESRSLRQILEAAEGIAQTDSNVLIEGETGTGKEIVAELIHRSSARRERNFSVLNCGSLSENLIDAELFGHEKGAFTGATEARLGIIEITDGGTLLLDEIGDMPLSAQVRLLRFLERGVFRRVGSSRERSVDVRVLAATHRDLGLEVKEGRFREDLYYRLLHFHLAIPPLRDRPDDVLPLARYYLTRMAAPGATPCVLSAQAESALALHPWPGNVRELSHAVERAVFAARIAGETTIEPCHLALLPPGGARSDLVSLREAERRHIQRVLDRVGGNRQLAAEVLGVSERHLYRMLRSIREEGQSEP
ncbi:MAG: sigma-54-dependent Fis family transcriptional regulator [Planctomycetes bacterium]|nr:sigma-54-dependent Fis family transcriptional regulator [Planctomycetota bacterium]